MADIFFHTKPDGTQVQVDGMAGVVRAQRDEQLEKTDAEMAKIMETSDSWDEFKVARTELNEYRQQLRDIPQQPGFPNDVEWPDRALISVKRDNIPDDYYISTDHTVQLMIDKGRLLFGDKIVIDQVMKSKLEAMSSDEEKFLANSQGLEQCQLLRDGNHRMMKAVKENNNGN